MGSLRGIRQGWPICDKASGNDHILPDSKTRLPKGWEIAPKKLAAGDWIKAPSAVPWVQVCDGIMKSRDIISSLVWMGVGITFCIGSLQYEFSRMGTIGGGFFPFLAGSVLVVLSIILLISALSVKKEAEIVRENFLPYPDSLRKLLLGFSALFAYVLILQFLGFFLTTFLFMAFLLRFIEPQRWRVVFPAAFLTSTGAHIVFHLWLKVQLPTGFWGM